jgi:hypothetical protein
VDSISFYLDFKEQLLWHGRPDPDSLVRRQYGWCFLIGSFFGLSLLWARYALDSGTSLSIALALVFVALGLAAAVAKAREILSARRLRYAVTDRRAMIVTEDTVTKVQSFTPDEIGPIIVKARKDGLTDIMFHRQDRFYELRGSGIVTGGFLSVSDAQGAQEALSRLIDETDKANR